MTPPRVGSSRGVNDEIASLARERPRRFAGLATLPVQDVKAAIDELERAVTVLGLKGAELDTVVNGEQWDEPKFMPLFKAAEALGAVLFFHPQPQDNFMLKLTLRHGFFNSLGVIMEDALLVATLIFGGILEACPNLKAGLYARSARSRFSSKPITTSPSILMTGVVREPSRAPPPPADRARCPLGVARASS